MAMATELPTACLAELVKAQLITAYMRATHLILASQHHRFALPGMLMVGTFGMTQAQRTRWAIGSHLLTRRPA